MEIRINSACKSKISFFLYPFIVSELVFVFKLVVRGMFCYFTLSMWISYFIIERRENVDLLDLLSEVLFVALNRIVAKCYTLCYL